MSFIATHPQAAIDRFAALVDDVRVEFGEEGLMANVERFISAERPEFIWDGRFQEHYLGEWMGDDDGAEGLHCILILSHFRGEFIVASCLVDGDERLHSMTRQCAYGSRAAAGKAFQSAACR
ncbi:hypothetical protein [Niveispirillum sp.]|uniref:hypothetical protein n=1 Tax=Niveispirillum sp. TaxID=1917217 RepID=UPI001B3F345C|nr:hypothetical protein [Niveispirillum sp.]MBP7339650.1 hypothetical protein [Niveispirillum sp.]